MPVRINFIDLSFEELTDMINSVFNIVIYKFKDNKFYIDDNETGNF